MRSTRQNSVPGETLHNIHYRFDLWMNILAWSSFLILTGALAGRQAHRMRTETEELKKLKQDLTANNEKLEGWVEKLTRLSE